MGVTGLDNFVRTQLPNGFPMVNITDEISNYKLTTSRPTIVIDAPALIEPVCSSDLSGVLCGGRYEVVFQLVERFLKQLQALGVTTVFFYDRPVKISRTISAWTDRHNKKYRKELKILDSVDNGDRLSMLAHRYRFDIPNNTQYPVKILVKRHGEFRVAVTGDTKKEMVAYANSVNAMAIISNNTDLLIFPGEWRFWSSKDLNFEKLTTREFSRTALRTHLGVTDPGQLALLATLASNNGFIQSAELSKFNKRYLKDSSRKFHALAEFVRRSHGNLMVEIFGKAAGKGDLRLRFQESLDYYGKEYVEHGQPSSKDPMLEFLREHGKAFLFKMWVGFPLHYAASLIDLRDNGLGAEYPALSRMIVLREAAIIVYHIRDQPGCKNRRLIHKTSHEGGYAGVTYQLEFPQHVEPPTLQELLSRNPETHAKLAETKLKLYAWIVSDNLDHRQLAASPPKLMPTLATLYFMVEHQVLEIFEADLFLYVAHEIVNKTIDMTTIRYPQNLDGRAFRVVFLYNGICQHVLKALNVVGLDTQAYPTYPQFDGVRFHNLYRGWARGERDLKQIRQLRIYENIF